MEKRRGFKQRINFSTDVSFTAVSALTHVISSRFVSTKCQEKSNHLRTSRVQCQSIPVLRDFVKQQFPFFGKPP